MSIVHMPQYKSVPKCRCSKHTRRHWGAARAGTPSHSPVVLDNKKAEVMLSFTTCTLFCLKAALHQQRAFTKTSTPMGAQMDASIFSTYPVWGLSVKMTNALFDDQEHWPGSFALLRTKQLLFQSLLSDLLCVCLRCLSASGKSIINGILGELFTGKRNFYLFIRKS